jgi:hypothetical protein
MANDAKAHDSNGLFHNIVSSPNSFPLDEASDPQINNHNFGATTGGPLAEHQLWPITAEDFALEYPSSTAGTNEVFRTTDRWLQFVYTTHQPHPPLPCGILTNILLTMRNT